MGHFFTLSFFLSFSCGFEHTDYERKCVLYCTSALFALLRVRTDFCSFFVHSLMKIQERNGARVFAVKCPQKPYRKGRRSLELGLLIQAWELEQKFSMIYFLRENLCFLPELLRVTAFISPWTIKSSIIQTRLEYWISDEINDSNSS